MSKPEARIIENRFGLDDLFQPNADIHIEHLGKNEYFIGISHEDGSRIVLGGKKIHVQWVEPAVSTQSEETT